MKFLSIATVLSIAIASSASAGGHTQKDKAQNMRDALQSTDSGNASEPARSYTGGWGNIAGPANENGKKNVKEK